LDLTEMDASKRKELNPDGDAADKYVSAGIVTDDFGELLKGEEAMVATADLLYQRLRLDQRLLRFMNGNNNLKQLAMRLRLFLKNAFDQHKWPNMRVRDSDIEDCVGDLADVLSEALLTPMPLGEDPLACALANLHRDWGNDPRIVTFFKKFVPWWWTRLKYLQ